MGQILFEMDNTDRAINFQRKIVKFCVHQVKEENVENCQVGRQKSSVVNECTYVFLFVCPSLTKPFIHLIFIIKLISDNEFLSKGFKIFPSLILYNLKCQQKLYYVG